ncbi:Aspartate--tRNA(Asp/Asn) ligase [Amphibalanus amphitrite]|uniref:Aspartate--tRNA(Asp/Asn) ligase n=1 Tax=Amphibalanus amphitrite TaxID=1232801 RepID=A0A6A4V543_AMPAM|nr:Aspartate--tRNA(Asp/Asn) ligase [Amphibalanus amphitrite]KAF0288862.1 Aspartate--tRNA(Asp/Asn) ligase [Amphibalanus amphitrite]KAF0288863.1 Aspartate--tRNA(Asp/Asn) ligase [Amphibalanus amphitrite]
MSCQHHLMSSLIPLTSHGTIAVDLSVCTVQCVCPQECGAMLAGRLLRVWRLADTAAIGLLRGLRPGPVGRPAQPRLAAPAAVRRASSFQHRTHTCGQLRAKDAGRSVSLCGWLQFKRMGKFITLRDGYGVTQLILPDEDRRLSELVDSLPLESVLQVTGAVRLRPDGQQNQDMKTGDIEVVAHDITVLNKPERELPFNAKEALRLQYRYLDLRHTELQENLRRRSQMVAEIREYLVRDHDFVDIETPTLFRRTPGGAQEFVVPTRSPGQFYSLVQSPQQFKQLLVIGGLDRYFQIARCYRDEGARPDRQPEFTQVDLELGFTSQQEVQALVEGMLHRCWPQELVTPFPRITFSQAMTQYGTDKPDVRFKWRLVTVTRALRSCGLDVLEKQLNGPEGAAVALVVPDGARHHSRAVQAQHARMAEQAGLAGVSALPADGAGRLGGRLAAPLGADTCSRLAAAAGAGPGDLLLLAAGPEGAARTLLGRLRTHMADTLEEAGVTVRRAGPHFLWVVDFPLFVREEGRLVSAHHPFTRPHAEDEHIVYSDPEQARSQHFDLVLNGWEVGGGSMRIHEPALQRHVLQTVLGEDTAPLQHLLDALASGAPPHGGIALGLDRLVALAAGAPSIRDVIAFPKSSDGRDLMAGAPSDISREEYELYHLKKPS